MYLGLRSGQPRLRLEAQVAGETRVLELVADRQWDLSSVFDRLPALRGRGLRLAFDILDVDRERLRLAITTSMGVTYEGGWDTLGLRMGDALALPDADQQLVNWLIRQREAGLPEVSAHSGQDQAVVRSRLNSLVERGFVEEVDVGGQSRYRARFGRRRASTLPDHIWHAIGEDSTAQSAGTRRERARALTQRMHDLALGERGRLVLSLLPLFAVFLLCESLLLTGAESFSGPLSFGGVITATLVGGIFPVLMLVASRRSFKPRAVLELRADQQAEQGAVYAVTIKGLLRRARVRLSYADGEQTCQAATSAVPNMFALRRAVFYLPPGEAKELKVWAHLINRQGESEGLPALVDISCGQDGARQFDLRLSGEQVVVPLATGECTVQVSLAESRY